MNSPNRTTPRVTVAGAGCGLSQDSDSSLSARSPAKAALDKSPRLRSGRRHCTASRRRAESGVYTVTAGTGRMRTWTLSYHGWRETQAGPGRYSDRQRKARYAGRESLAAEKRYAIGKDRLTDTAQLESLRHPAPHAGSLCALGCHCGAGAYGRTERWVLGK